MAHGLVETGHKEHWDGEAYAKWRRRCIAPIALAGILLSCVAYLISWVLDPATVHVFPPYGLVLSLGEASFLCVMIFPSQGLAMVSKRWIDDPIPGEALLTSPIRGYKVSEAIRAFCGAARCKETEFLAQEALFQATTLLLELNEINTVIGSKSVQSEFEEQIEDTLNNLGKSVSQAHEAAERSMAEWLDYRHAIEGAVTATKANQTWAETMRSLLQSAPDIVQSNDNGSLHA